MGAYLSQPNTEKHSEDGEGPGAIRYGVSEMQGWRMHMEDAHITKPEVGRGSGMFSIFAVFDGHGGQEVAKFSSKYMTREFERILADKKGDFEAALPLAFHRIDTMLRDEAYSAEIRSLSRDAGSSPAVGGGAARAVGNAAQVKNSIDNSLEEARKKGKLSQKEAMELMVKMMALQRMEKGGAAAGAGESTSFEDATAGELLAQDAPDMMYHILTCT